MSKSKWSTQPKTDEWNTESNWEPEVVPTDEAVFSESSENNITFSPTSKAQVNTIEFTKDASPFTFKIGVAATDPALTIGEGVVNNSEHNQQFIVASNGVTYKEPQLKFTNSATAGGENVHYYAGPSSLEGGFGGGIIGFSDNATAGSASFIVKTGAGIPPKKGSTVGAEVSFCDNSSAGRGHFKSYGTLGTDGDTFGNVVFHDDSNADHGTFISVGGTVNGGDGGNTQFYDNANAAHGVYINYGGTIDQANGGDAVFDGNSNGGHGHFYNYAAEAAGAYGGVISFNNNPPNVQTGGSSAGEGCFHNYGATVKELGGGGHIEFGAVHGCPTAGNGAFNNYGSMISDNSSAGHTIFSINLPTDYFPTAGNGTFWNHPSMVKDGTAGYTEFSVYGTGSGTNVPTAGEATFYNLGGKVSGAVGGYTTFSGSSDAANSTLVSFGGTNGGAGGRIVFSDSSLGGEATVFLYGNGELDISYHENELTIGSLEMSGGTIVVQLGDNPTGLTLSGDLTLNSGLVAFSFPTDGGTFEYDKPYTILTCPNLSNFQENQFVWNNLDGVKSSFSIVGNNLQVSFSKEE
ncbi:MAG: hypothetical protein CL840_12610 [Crocinitomicaceae bacterium]|nr:hypothetical protein [Crocinitomicaceae bacterium]|tara:strand:+ start:2148 stop:3875 length:1728 start_codon:yes stop_codon:yes gene_type:complete